MMRLVTRLGGTARGVPQPSTGITGDCALFAIAICRFTGENIRDRSNVANIAANVIRIRPARHARGVRDGIAMHHAESKSKTIAVVQQNLRFARKSAWFRLRAIGAVRHWCRHITVVLHKCRAGCFWGSR